MVNATPGHFCLGKHTQYPEVEWGRVPVWTVAENLAPDCPDRNHSLYLARYPDPYISMQQQPTLFNTLRKGDADLRFYITTVQDG